MKEISNFDAVKPSRFALGPRRAGYYDVTDIIMASQFKAEEDDIQALEDIDVLYRALASVLYNFAPVSGHPGGSISSGRIAQALLFSSLDYDFFDPLKKENDILLYAAGHKALGLYALWALRDELLRAAGSANLPREDRRLRLEDLLGFRRGPAAASALLKRLNSKNLDGHPTPLTPFVPVATGASGAGAGAAAGLALAAMDLYGAKAPRVNFIEGEGGLTAGRAAEVLASAATAQLSNLAMHLDWNQSSIDSDNVCPENLKPGDYVQWTPGELAYLNDWNVVYVPNGHDFFQILAAQSFIRGALDNRQPAAIVYRTVKGWRYGMEGRASHGAGHAFGSDGYHASLAEFEARFGVDMPRCPASAGAAQTEEHFYKTLLTVRMAVENSPSVSSFARKKTDEAWARLAADGRKRRADAPDPQKAYTLDPAAPPAALKPAAGRDVFMRETLAGALNQINRLTGGAVMVSAADLCSSTGVTAISKGFGDRFYNSVSNPGSRIYAGGGICEDAMGSIMSGLSAFGSHIGVTCSYAAFLAPLGHIPARLHAIGQQARRALDQKPSDPFIMINAHAGIMTGEDGPTHADPQALQLLERNFPGGAMITLTPWEPGEIWPLLAAALAKRPAIIAPFVPRPGQKVPDRTALGLPPALAAAKGIYPLLKAGRGRARGAIVLQGSGAAGEFVREVLPRVKEAGLNLDVFYVSSSELFDLLGEEERRRIYPESLALKAMGITDFTPATMDRWVRSDAGRARTLHPFRNGRYLCSGRAGDVLKEAGLDGPAQWKAISEYARALEEKK